jgi:aldose sugar dehydrogenase
MKTPVGLVAVSLTAAIMLAVSLVIATGTRGEEPVFGSSAGELEVRTIARGLSNPWALASCLTERCW